jgi:hypothetical protein
MTKIALLSLAALSIQFNGALCAEEPPFKVVDPTWAFEGFEDNEHTGMMIHKLCQDAYPKLAAVRKDCVEKFRRDYVRKKGHDMLD